MFQKPRCYIKYDNMSRIMRISAFCLCENKDADQLRDNLEGYNCSTFEISNFKPLAHFCDYTARFVSDQFENHIVGFLMAAQLSLFLL